MTDSGIAETVKTIKAIVKLTRPEHALLLALAVFAGEIISLQKMPEIGPMIATSLLVPVFIEMASFAHNDILDLESDRLNKKRGRPLVSRELKVDAAWAIVALGYAAGLVLAWMINVQAFGMALAFTVLSVAYNARLKDMPLLGNVAIGLSMAVPFAFGAVSVEGGGVTPALAFIMLAAMLGGTAREIVKSVQDVEGDVGARKSNTLPVAIGKEKSLIAAKALLAAAILVSYLPFVYLRAAMPALVLVGAGDGLLLLATLKLNGEKERLEMAREFTLFAFALVTVGYLLAAVI